MTGDDADDDLDEESLLETPLDEVEPYGALKGGLVRKYNRMFAHQQG